MPPPLNVDHVIEARKPPPDINNLSSDQAATAQRDYLTYLLQRYDSSISNSYIHVLSTRLITNIYTIF